MEWEGIDCILEVTGAIDFGARVALEAFKHKKHVIAMNAELDGTIGPILKVLHPLAFVAAILGPCFRPFRGVCMRSTRTHPNYAYFM